jgi:ribosome-associated toxin RatA of RatAB toxin-antitoxin module
VRLPPDLISRLISRNDTRRCRSPLSPALAPDIGGKGDRETRTLLPPDLGGKAGLGGTLAKRAGLEGRDDAWLRETLAKRAGFTALVTLLLGLVFTSPANADDTSDLDAGKILVTSVAVAGSTEPEHVVRAVVESPPAVVWKVVSECDHFRERMPHIAAAHEVSRAGNTVTCETTIAMPFPTSNLTATTEAIHVQRPDGMSRTWHLVRGDYEFNEGSWTIQSYRGGAASLVTYRVHVKPKTAIPGFIRNIAQEHALPDLLARVRVESAKLQ